MSENLNNTNNPIQQPDFSKLNHRDEEFNDASMGLIAAWYRYYGDLFMASEDGQAMSDDDRKEFDGIFSSFCDFCYSYHLQKPGQWSKKAVYEVCAYIIPRKVVADELFFKAIIPGMITFLRWAEQYGILNKTGEIQKAIQSSANELHANSANSSQWGIGKSLFMNAQAQGIDMTRQENWSIAMDNYNEQQKSLSANEKKLSRRVPKLKGEMHTLEDILGDLSYLLAGFPKAAIDAALDRKEEITPFLLDTLNDALKNYDSLEDDDLSAIYAVYLLAKFRENRAFSIIMDILHLPEHDCERILGPDGMTDYAIKNIIASTFNGDLQRIYQLAEDRSAYEYCRATAIESLLPLYASGQVSYETVIEYYRHLLNGGLEKDQPVLWGLLAFAIMDIYAEELYEPMKAAFQIGLINPDFVRLQEFEKHFTQNKESVRKERLYNHYHLIDDVVNEMSWWACFKEDNEPLHSNHDLMGAGSWGSHDPVRRELPKIGRNDICPCGSGKKYKKCCLH